MADFSTPIDIACPLPDGQNITANITGSATGAAGTFNGGATLPDGCNLVSESITIVIDGESFGPFTTLPTNLGPLAAGAFAGTSFSLSGTLTNFSIAPTTGYVGSIPVVVTYDAEGDICGTDSSTGSIVLDWVEPIAAFTQTDNGSGNIVFDSATSSDTSCPGSFTGYLWTIYASDGTTVLNAHVDYTLNSANLTSATLDVTLPVGDYVAELEVTTDCGTNSTTQNANVVLLPIRGFVGSDDIDLNSVTITTGGSQDASGGNIENDGTASYSDEFKGPNDEQLFTVTYAGNGAVTLSVFNASLSGADQTAISALFSGNGGSTGYTFDKEAVHDILFAAGVYPDGGEWTVCGTVTHAGATSTVVEYTIATEFAMVNNFALRAGNVGPSNLANTVRIGYARGYRNNAGFSFVAAASNVTSNQVNYEGSVITGHGTTDPIQSQALPSVNPLSIENFGVPINSSVQGESLETGLFAYATQWNQYDDNNPGVNPATPSNVRISPSSDTYASINVTTGAVNLGMNFDPTGSGALGTNTLATSSFDVQRFAQGAGGITITGVNDANNATTPQVGNISAGSLQTYAVTNPSNLTMQFTADASGDYYAQIDAVDSIGNNIQSIHSYRIKKY